MIKEFIKAANEDEFTADLATVSIVVSIVALCVLAYLTITAVHEAWLDRQWIEAQEQVVSEMERQCSLAWPLHGANYQACLDED